MANTINLDALSSTNAYELIDELPSDGASEIGESDAEEDILEPEHDTWDLLSIDENNQPDSDPDDDIPLINFVGWKKKRFST